MAKSCLTCDNWLPEPWDLMPEQRDAWCIIKSKRTLSDDLCGEHNKTGPFDVLTGRPWVPKKD